MKKAILLCGLLALTGCSKVTDKVTDIAINDTSEKPVSAVEKDTTKKTVICTGPMMNKSPWNQTVTKFKS